MYGSIMLAKAKEGQEDALRSYFEQWSRDVAAFGHQSTELAWQDDDPRALVAIIRFRDKTSYRANGERPETDAAYRGMLEFIDGEVRWIDLNYEGPLGRPAAVATATQGDSR